MEIVLKKNAQQPKTQKKSKKQSSTQIVAVVPKTSVKNKSKSSRKSPKMSASNFEKSMYYQALTRPDLTGPIRIPREGGATRTVLAMDKTYLNIGNTAAYTLIVGGTTYFGSTAQTASYYTAANAATNWGSFVAFNAGIQFPSPLALNDVNFIASNLLIDYIGAPLNVTGEMLIGDMPEGSPITAITYNTLANYPGVIRIPLKDLVTGGAKSVFARKFSPESNSFVNVNAGNVNINVPFAAFSLTAANSVVSVLGVRTFEGRPMVYSSGIPFEKTTDSFTKDLNMFQDALATLSEIPYAVTDGFTEYIREMTLGALGATASGPLVRGLTLTGSAAIHALTNRHLARLGGTDRV